MSYRIAMQFAQWFTLKAQVNAEQSGVYQAARNLRKQGIPISFALAMLCGRA